MVDPGISLKVKDVYLHKCKPEIFPLVLKLNINDHPIKVYDSPEALCCRGGGAVYETNPKQMGYTHDEDVGSGVGPRPTQKGWELYRTLSCAWTTFLCFCVLSKPNTRDFAGLREGL